MASWAHLLVVLVCVQVSSAAVKNGSSSSGPRTFAISYQGGPTYEPLDLDSIFPVDFGESKNLSNRSRPMQLISEDTLLFLTGPMSTIFMPSYYTLVCLISIPINLCAMVAFAHRIRPKKTAAIFMLNLACADLLFTALLPFRISYHVLGNNWIFGSVMCRIVTAAFYWNMYCSVLLICCISMDRLFAVVYPIYSLAWRRPRNAIKACVTMWILSFAASIPLLLTEQTTYLEALNITTCHDVQPLEEIKWTFKIYFITICCGLFFLPLLITFVSYARVVWSLSRIPQGIRGSTRKSRDKARAVVMAITVFVMFVLCFMPTNCIMLAHYLLLDNSVANSHQAPDSSYALYLVFLCLGSVNCCLDPMVYYFGSSQCQKQLSSALKCKKAAAICSASHSSSNSYNASRNPILKSSLTETTRLNTSSETESYQGHLNSQYKKLLV